MADITLYRYRTYQIRHRHIWSRFHAGGV